VKANVTGCTFSQHHNITLQLDHPRDGAVRGWIGQNNEPFQLVGFALEHAAVRRLDAGSFFAQNRAGYRVGSEGGAPLQSHVVSKIVDTLEIVERVRFWDIDRI
jgi:hypothetical protein